MRRVSHAVDVSGPDAFLEVDEPAARRMPAPEEIGDERMHACRREQDGGIVLGKQGCALYAGVAQAGEIVDEEGPEFV